MKKNIYSSKLLHEVIYYKSIPRHINQYEHLKLYHKYYIPELGLCKVLDIESIDGREYYFIRYDNKYGCISYPVSNINTYELLHNYDNIENDNIINSSKSYTGAEIRFWFSINNTEKYYNKFLKFILYDNNESSIIDNKYYFVRLIKNKASIILDKNKSH